MTNSTDNTDRTGWAEASIPLNWSDEHPAEEGEWTECDAPDSGHESGLDLDEEKLAEAEEKAQKVNELLGF